MYDRRQNVTDIQIPDGGRGEHLHRSNNRLGVYFTCTPIFHARKPKAAFTQRSLNSVWGLPVMTYAQKQKRRLNNALYLFGEKHGKDNVKNCERNSGRHMCMVPSCSSPFAPSLAASHPPLTRLFYAAVAKFGSDVYTRPFPFFLFLPPFRQTIICK